MFSQLQNSRPLNTYDDRWYIYHTYPQPPNVKITDWMLKNTMWPECKSYLRLKIVHSCLCNKSTTVTVMWKGKKDKRSTQWPSNDHDERKHVKLMLLKKERKTVRRKVFRNSTWLQKTSSNPVMCLSYSSMDIGRASGQGLHFACSFNGYFVYANHSSELEKQTRNRWKSVGKTLSWDKVSILWNIKHALVAPSVVTSETAYNNNL